MIFFWLWHGFSWNFFRGSGINFLSSDVSPMVYYLIHIFKAQCTLAPCSPTPMKQSTLICHDLSSICDAPWSVMMFPLFVMILNNAAYTVETRHIFLPTLVDFRFVLPLEKSGIVCQYIRPKKSVKAYTIYMLVSPPTLSNLYQIK